MTTGTPRPVMTSQWADEQLDRRVADALATAARLLGRHVGDTPSDEPWKVADAIAALVERLTAETEDHGTARESQAVHERDLVRLRAQSDGRFGALEDARAAVARLRQITSPDAMLASAPAELVASSELDRVLLSLVSDGHIVAEAVHFRDDGAGGSAAMEALRAEPVRLQHPLIETEILRRSRATVVAGAHVHPRVARGMAAIMDWESYVAAPVTVRSDVIAVIHADRVNGRQLDVLHRDVLWEFAAHLAQAYESANLRRTLRQERMQMRRFLEWLNARSAELNDAAIELVPRQRTDLPPTIPLDAQRPQIGTEDRTVFSEILTRRELEVLRLLTLGRTNRAIAAELVISPGTVKFHVNSIFRKLRVANRAQAVSRYFALLGVGSTPSAAS